MGNKQPNQKSNQKNNDTSITIKNKEYKIIRELGRDTFGRVVQVLSKSNKKHYAIKIIQINEVTKESPNFKAVYRYDFSNLVKNPSADSEVIKSEERHMDCALLAQLYQWKLSKLQKLKPYLSNIKKLQPKLAKFPKNLKPLRNSTNLLRESLIIVDFADLFRHNLLLQD